MVLELQIATNTHTDTHTDTNSNTHTQIHAQTHTQTQTQTHTQIPTQTHKQRHIHKHTLQENYILKRNEQRRSYKLKILKEGKGRVSHKSYVIRDVSSVLRSSGDFHKKLFYLL